MMKFAGKKVPFMLCITLCLLISPALFSGLSAQDATPAPQVFNEDNFLGLSLAWSPDGKYIAMDDRNNDVIVYDAVTGSVVQTLTGMREWSSYLVWSPDNRYLAAGGQDMLQWVWEVESGATISRYATDLYGGDGAWSPDSRYVAAAGYDTLLIVDMQHPDSPIYEAADAAYSILWLDDDTLLYTSYDRLHSIEFDGETLRGRRTLYRTGIDTMIRLSSDGAYLALVEDLETLTILDTATWQVVSQPQGHGGEIGDFAWSPQHHILATAGKDDTIRLWDVNGTELLRLTHERSALEVAWSPDGSLLATRHLDTYLWDLGSYLAVFETAP